ncbi:hypothetical protein ACQKM2_22165 [Streptomyces sp. NPDC004126]|uniref:hypothetical protein n=1 Tax=Streptomyces sp. NPDC004126 TaxID=3390695 RepID=UPI003D0262A0
MTPGSTVLPELEMRPHGREWLVGRQDTGTAIALPPEGLDALLLLDAGCPPDEARAALRHATGRDLDVRAFAEGLGAAGLADAVGDHRYEHRPVRESLPAVRRRHLRWTLHPALHGVLLLLALCGPVVALAEPDARPPWSDLLAPRYGVVTLAVQAVTTWTLILLHELAHLFTARAVGVRGRLGLGTRLQFLVAQTEVSGIWLKGRRERLTVYLSGLVLDAAIAGACLIARAAGADHPLLSVVVLTLTYSSAVQCLVFMRTDLYYVLQDLSGSHNLYAEATALLRRFPPAGRRHAGARLGVHAYALLVAIGSAACVVFGLAMLHEVTLPLAGRSMEAVVGGRTPAERADGLATLLVLLSIQGLWARTWWRKHWGKGQAPSPTAGLEQD